MLREADILAILRTVDDPEMPISIVDLGLVARVELIPRGDEASVAVDLVPTFVGCPALFMIENEVREKLLRAAGVSEARVNWVYDPPWSVDRISAAGRAQLAKAGITTPSPALAAAPAVVQLGLPDAAVSGARESVPCPLCEATDTTLESPFGPTRCKMIYYCNACRNSFEHLKRI